MQRPLAKEHEQDITAILGPETAGVVLPRLRSLVRLVRQSTARPRVDPDASGVATTAAALVEAVTALSPSRRRDFLSALHALGLPDDVTGATPALWLLALQRFVALHTRLTRRKPGRPRNKTRRVVLMQLFHILHNAGVRITKGRRGRASRVAEILLTATGDHVEDFFRDLVWAANNFTREVPDTLPVRRDGSKTRHQND
jgi:hypothetical protein